MEIFKIPTGETIKTIAIPMHPLEFWIENYGNLNGFFDPADQKEISLYDANGMLDFSAIDQHRVNGKIKKKSPTGGLNFINLFERCGTNNEGVVLAPCSIPTRTVRMIINHVSEHALDLHVATDEMHISLETNRGEVNVRVSGVSKLAVAKQNRRPFNYSILQPGTQIVEEYMQRSSQLMQYLIDNRNAFQDDLEYWGVKGDQLKKMIRLYLQTDGKTNLESFKGDKYVTRLIRLVHSYNGTEDTLRRFGIGSVVKRLVKPSFRETFEEAIDQFNTHKNPFRERTLRLVLTAIMGKLLQYTDDYSTVRLAEQRKVADPRLEGWIRQVGITQQQVTKVLRSMGCVQVVATKKDSDGLYDEYKLAFVPNTSQINSPVDERCTGCSKIKSCYAAKQRRDAWVESSSKPNDDVRGFVNRYFGELDGYLSGDGNDIKIVIL